MTEAHLNYLKQLKEGWDVILDPVETTPLMNVNAEAGSWAQKYLEIDVNRNDILKLLNRKVVVYVHDTAGMYKHPDLRKVAWNEKGKVFTGEPSPEDGHNHSTHVAGIIAALNKNMPLGVADAMAEQGLIKIIPHKCLNNNGSGSYSWILESLSQAVKEGIELQKEGWFVMHNFSLGGGGTNAPIEEKITEAWNAGQMVLASSGNGNSSTIGFPAKAKDAMAIGSITSSGDRSSFSNYGTGLAFVAPGSSILSTIPGGGYATYSGTSMACPAKAALFALAASIFPEASNVELKAFYENYSFDLGEQGWDNFFGWGVAKYNSWKEQKPGEEAPEPPKPPEGPTLRERRDVAVNLQGYDILWKRHNIPELHGLHINDIEISVSTEYTDAYTADQVNERVAKYFTRRYLSMPDRMGFNDAAYYTGLFLEILGDKESTMVFKIMSMRYTDDEGRQGSWVPRLKSSWARKARARRHYNEKAITMHEF